MQQKKKLPLHWGFRCQIVFRCRHWWSLEHFFKILQKSPWTLKIRTIVDWLLTGITTKNIPTFTCKFTYPKTSKVLSIMPPKTNLCTPEMNSFSIWPNHSVFKRTRKHPNLWRKINQRHTNQGWVITILLTIIWSNHVACFKWDSFLQRQTKYSQK